MSDDFTVAKIWRAEIELHAKREFCFAWHSLCFVRPLNMSTKHFSPARKKRIMIVDDQKAATAMWRSMLEKTGTYVVREENRSRNAVQAAREFAPDLIVLDLNMPELDGSEVASGISKDSRLRGTPILFMTSLVSEAEIARGKRIDGFPCVAKPTTLDGFVGSIEKHLAGRSRDHVRTLTELAA